MNSNRLVKVLTSQYSRFHRNPEDNIIIVIDPDNIKIWYVLIIGSDEPYCNAEILFQFTIPDRYPHEPPSVECLTPNGIFLLGGPLCISISEFHKEDWVKSLGITGYSKQLWDALLFFTSKETTGSLNLTWTEPEERKKLAKESYNYNLNNNKKIINLINDFIESYPNYTSVKLLLSNRT